MNWVRGKSLGNGSFATVNKATSVNFPFPTAVKSTDLQDSHFLIIEEQVLNQLQTCPHIIKCFGHDTTLENGEEYYNVFLEYASNGTLADIIKNHGGKFQENLVRTYTKSILEGLKYIHDKGFVHCDVKLQNILVFDKGNVKIADFGLAKEKGKKHSDKVEFRGTPMFMSPESVNDNEYEPPVDIWALGCAVVEMVTGKPAWDIANGSNMWKLMIRIGVGDELPKIPDELSENGKDFLRKCFVKDPLKRWSAEMLLNHAFIVDDTVLLEKKVNGFLPSSSPRRHFDSPHWTSSTVTSLSSPFSPDSHDRKCVSISSSPAERLRQLVTDEVTLNWSESDSWSIVRSLVDKNV